ncbi:MAG: sulfatase [Phycisphaeraceae bacterium]|nr:sulfatase [Phycisphaeraceae bacterium]
MKTIVILCDTLRRDHCSPYTQGKPLNECWGDGAPPWAVNTPNMQRLADRGTTFTNAWCGSTPCMPARRDIYTGRYEFLERGWGPLTDNEQDLPRQISGEPNLSITKMLKNGHSISQLITDHFHLWEQGAGNYHMGYTGHEFIRGIESDAYRTDYLEAGSFDCPAPCLDAKTERHYRNMHLMDRSEHKDWTAAKTFDAASTWLTRNHQYDDFHLHIDCFPPHEPLDPPEDLLKQFYPKGYDVPDQWRGGWGYDTIENLGFEPERVKFCQALYAANVVLADQCMGQFLDTMDELNLWDDTLLIFTTDHGTYNGDHGRLGKLQTHQHDAVGHIPFIVCHPTQSHGQVREQLVQLVDIYPTVLRAMNRDLPEDVALHGVDLLPLLADPHAKTRDYLLAGQFGKSMTLTDGQWILHQSPASPKNQPLNWYGYHLSRFMAGYELGDYDGVSRPCNTTSWATPTWLSDKQTDINELNNLAPQMPQKVQQMQAALREKLTACNAPTEQILRLGL